MGKRENILGAQAAQAFEISKQTRERTGLIEDFGQLVRGSFLGGEGDLASVTERWKSSFAEPAMSAWWEYNAPQIRDEFAGIPGGFYSADRGRGVSREANRYMAQSITPTLYGSLESAISRMFGLSSNLLGLGGMSVPAAPVSQEGRSTIAPAVGTLGGVGMAQLFGGGAFEEEGGLSEAGATWGGLGSLIASLFL